MTEKSKSNDKIALNTGVTGQDGSYLAEFLLAEGYQVRGIRLGASLFNTSRVNHSYQEPHIENARFKLHYAGALSDEIRTQCGYSGKDTNVISPELAQSFLKSAKIAKLSRLLSPS